MSVEQLDQTLLVGALALLVAVGAVRLSVRLGLPSLLTYLALGVVLGDGVLGVATVGPEAAHTLGYAALVVILAEGGLTTRWSVVRPGLPTALSLSTVGVAVSIAVTAVAAHLLLGLDAEAAVLLGAVVASTDAAAVFSTLRRVPLPPRLVGALEGESGTNDAPVVLLVTLLAEGALAEQGYPLVAATIVYELAAGTVVGVGAGWLGVVALRRAALPASGLYPLAVLGFCVLGYGTATALHASGFLAVYVAGLWLGNHDLPHRPATRSFVEGLGWLAQIGLFVLLGLLADVRTLLDEAVPALLVGLALLLVARPLSVLVAATPLRVPLREQVFLSWAGLRGAVPIVLATVPVTEGVPGSDRVVDLVFVLVVVFTLVQGPTLVPVARLLGLIDPERPQDLEIEAAPLGEAGAEVLQLAVKDGSRLQGVEVGELRLPSGSSVSIVVRAGVAHVPEPGLRIRSGDQLLVVTTPAARQAAEERLRAIGRGGRLAGWGDTPPG